MGLQDGLRNSPVAQLNLEDASIDNAPGPLSPDDQFLQDLKKRLISAEREHMKKRQKRLIPPEMRFRKPSSKTARQDLQDLLTELERIRKKRLLVEGHEKEMANKLAGLDERHMRVSDKELDLAPTTRQEDVK